MKKKYSLDYSIERDTDRLKAVVQILDELDKDPSRTDLEQMASYILYGKDENGLNAIKRGECTDENRRYKTFRRASERTESFDALLENPVTDPQTFHPFNQRNIYVKKIREVKRPHGTDPGDSDVPGLPQLWERIDYLERVLAANEGKIPFDDTLTILKDSYSLYKLRHQLIDMRRHQYYLRDSYKPAIHFLNVKQSPSPPQNFTSDSYYWLSFAQWRRRLKREQHNPFISTNLRDYETRFYNGKFYVKWVVRHQKFDWENPSHVQKLMAHYSAIYAQNWDKLDSWGRALIFDFDRYFDLSDMSSLREFLVTRYIDKASPSEICADLPEKFGLTYHPDYLTIIFNREIPTKMVAGVKKHKLLVETPQDERKQCFRCKKWLPRNTLFFSINSGRKDGWASNCKECERLRRIERGIVKKYDQRSKNAQVYEMQARKANT